MTSATLDRLLAILVIAMAASGLASLRFGSAEGGWLFGVHGVVGGILLAAVAVKLVRSVPPAVRRGSLRRLAVGLLLAAMTLAALIGGLAWVASGRLLEIGSWTVLTLHAWAGLVLLPIVVVHLLPRRWRLLRPGFASPSQRVARGGDRRPIGRRSLLAAGLLAAMGASITVAADRLDHLAGRGRRFTGSRELPAGGIPPTTTFFGEPAPGVEPAAWRLSITGRVGAPASLSLEEVASLGSTDLTAILDCTSGWWIETGWRGVPLAAVLAVVRPSAAARRVTVRSATGWSAVLPIGEAERCLLATDVAGARLPLGNGAPLRLVAPDRRGLDWVKWVDRIEVA